MQKQEYIAKGEQNYAMRAAVEAVADKVCEKGFDKVVFVGSGGSLMMLDSLRYLLFQHSNIPVYSVSAAEVLTAGSKQISAGALVVILTLTGTKETEDVARFCKENGIDSVAFVGVENSPAGSLATHEIYNPEQDTTLRYLMLYFFCMKLAHNKGGFAGYVQFADELKNMAAAMWNVGEQFEAKAKEFGLVAGAEPFVMWVASGVAYAETARFANCTVEEMVWIKSQAVHSAEFFHGSFEIVDEDLCVLLVKNIDGNRKLDERVESFLGRFNKKHFIIDLADAKLEGFSPEFAPLLVGPALTVIFKGRVQPYLEQVTGRSIKTRRYYGVEQY